MTQQNYDKIHLKEGDKDVVHYYFHQDKCLFLLDKVKPNGLLYLRCIEASKGCKRRGKISNKVFQITNDENHNHEHHEYKANYEKNYEKLKELVKIDRRCVRDLHKEVLRGLGEEVAGLLAWKHCRNTLQRIRRSQMPSCSNLQELESLLEDQNGIVYANYGCLREKPFYQGAINGQLVFANLHLISELSNNFDLFLDATFNVVPFNAKQLLVIMGNIYGSPRPLVYVVMTGQTEKHHYTPVLEFMRDGILSFDGKLRFPKRAMSDFEHAIRLALKKVWPDIELKACNFHFDQALRRHARSDEKLSTKIKPGTIHKKVLLFFMRLSLLPLERVDNGYKAIINFIRVNHLSKDFEKFVPYFYNTYMLMYKKETWCVSDVSRRTNNNVEGYNNKIKSTISLNPSKWEFMDEILDLAFDASASYTSDVRTKAQPVDRSLLSKPLKEALQELGDGKIDELGFLEKLAKVSGKNKQNAPLEPE